MLAAEMVGSAALGAPVLSPIRLFSSIVLGPFALSPLYPAITTLIVGISVHALLSTSFGLVAFLGLAWSRGRSASVPRLLALGAAYGALLWALDFLFLGPVAFPQFTVVDLLWGGAVVHVVFFGLVLGAYAASSRARRSGVAG